LIAFPICIAINVLVVASLGSYPDAGFVLFFIAVPSSCLYIIFLGIEELLRPKKKEGRKLKIER